MVSNKTPSLIYGVDCLEGFLYLGRFFHKHHAYPASVYLTYKLATAAELNPAVIFSLVGKSLFLPFKNRSGLDLLFQSLFPTPDPAKENQQIAMDCLMVSQIVAAMITPATSLKSVHRLREDFMAPLKLGFQAAKSEVIKQKGLALIETDVFWFELLNKDSFQFFKHNLQNPSGELTLESLSTLCLLALEFLALNHPKTKDHCLRVGKVAQFLGKTLGLSTEDQALLQLAGEFHDIGKIAIPKTILNKTSKLDEAEFYQTRFHPLLVCHFFETIAPHLQTSSLVAKVKRWGSRHHERVDGTGYPFGLRGDQLEIQSQIVTAADIYVALRENRVYRDAFTPKGVQKILNENRNSILAPNLVDALLAHQADVEALLKI
ncbi:MAG: HD-GYP domain-containing protein [Candidatus Margulisiibacteriota bacterium]